MNNFILECTRCGRKIAIHQLPKDNTNIDKTLIKINSDGDYDGNVSITIKCECGNKAKIEQ